LPLDNIERAVKKRNGPAQGVTYEAVTYEAYGPGGGGPPHRSDDHRHPNRTVAENPKRLPAPRR